MPDAPPTTPPPAAPTSLAMKDLIESAGLKDRAYLSEYADKTLDKDTATALLKKLDGAETLIGRKIGIPGADAKPEEIEKFYKALGVEKAEGYDVKALGEKPDAEFAKEIQAAAHKGQLSQRQLNAFLGELAPKVALRQKAAAEAQAKLDQEFDGLALAAFGGEKDKVLDRVQGVLKEHTPKMFQAHIDRLSNQDLVLLAGVIDSVIKTYVPEDKIEGMSKAGGADNNSNDADALRKEARELMSKPAYTDFQHADHAKTINRVKEIYASPVFKK